MDSETDLYGITAKELQTDVTVGDGSISGALEHIEGYSGFSDVRDEQEGYYLALSIEGSEGADITTELVGGSKGEVKVTDGFCVYRITDKDTQRIRITAKKGDAAVEKEYDLTSLAGIDHVRDSGNAKVKDSGDGDIESSIDKEL